MRRLTFYEIGFSAFFPRTFHNGRTKRFQTASSRGNILGKLTSRIQLSPWARAAQIRKRWPMLLEEGAVTVPAKSDGIKVKVVMVYPPHMASIHQRNFLQKMLTDFRHNHKGNLMPPFFLSKAMPRTMSSGFMETPVGRPKRASKVLIFSAVPF